jgi:hypothetical protein
MRRLAGSNYGAGLIKTMQVVGVEPNSEAAGRWASAIGFQKKTSAVRCFCGGWAGWGCGAVQREV